ncbi:twin-arginine translocation signal domain-containing protein [Pseudochrobactrum kiredjianiae]|uniref:Twin-arginine translocation signal domain-containing protein n=1 Tax=Pseudochrobactrum kiredjianiae TaxID=386305 RepID=A0ABW3V630_9HYPH|nr:twin-arginine translocation signal domain-containing protein [Pseudochrobactrum kiredjianiae]MDM7849909.1 twin-arginine translocation signal domain-containing protein [Pseudochrobactrum kiredjianiae]
MTGLTKNLRGLSRRDLLKRGTAGAALIVMGNTVFGANYAWALESSALKPETMATLIKLARDIYPHDKLADRFYAIAIKGHETKAAKDKVHQALIEDGVADLDKRAATTGTSYRDMGWEEDRIAILRDIEDTPFFQAVRSDLVVSLYNQKELWPLFGYEGESYSKGGYIERGFDDIEWL